MRRLLTMAVVATIWSAAPLGHSQQPQDRWSTAQETGYAVGHDLGTQSLDRLRADGLEVDLASFVSGFADAVRGAEPRLSSAELEAVLARLEREVTTRAAEQRMASDPVFRALAEANLSKSRAFHEEFGRKTGVTTLSTGIQYEVIVRGSGGRVASDGTVVVTFKGKLLDGYVFGEAEQKEIRVSTMLPGGRDIVQRMRVGDRWNVAIPPDQAFGIGGRTPDIGPNETLLIDVTLLEIK